MPSSATAVEAAGTGLQVLPQLVTPETAKYLGFDTASEATVAKVDTESPWKEFVVDAGELKSTFLMNSVEPLLTETSNIIFPITVNEQVKSSLTVTKTHNGWKTTAWGSPNLIRGLTRNKTSATSFLVSIPQFNLYFVGNHNADGKLTLTSIKAVPQFKFEKDKTLLATEVFAILRIAMESMKPVEPGKARKPG